MQESSQVEAQLSAIRAAVVRTGSATVGCEELTLLCPNHMTVPEQFQRIAEIAEREAWKFAFLIGGAVRFRRFAAAP